MSESVKKNIWEKLQTMRCMLQDMAIKKSGWNDYSKYAYYELGDFLPHINNLQAEYKTMTQVSFTNEEATLTLINCENPQEQIVFRSPMADATLKAAHPIQNLGAVETYQRRYLYMTAFEIVESDALDKNQGGKNNGSEQKQEKPHNTNLSETTRKALNKQIMDYKKLTGKTAVTKMLEQEIGKPLLEVTEADAKKIGDILTKWQNKFVEELETGGQQ